MKRQRVRCEVESGSDRSGWHALGSSFHEQAKHIKAVILGECGQGRDDICLFHISTIIEIMAPVKRYFSDHRSIIKISRRGEAASVSGEFRARALIRVNAFGPDRRYTPSSRNPIN
jgi:hypothetical protein